MSNSKNPGNSGKILPTRDRPAKQRLTC
jgi:hypothetical protein